MSRKIIYQVTDAEALKAAYPQLFTPEVITRDVRNKELTYEVVKLNDKMGIPTPGVTIKARDGVPVAEIPPTNDQQ